MVDGTLKDPTSFERAAITLVSAAFERPRELSPADLDPLREIVGDGAIDYALVLTMFHFINRIADLLDVKQEVVPSRLRAFEFVRLAFVRMVGKVMQSMDLQTRAFAATFDETFERIQPLLPAETDPDAFDPIKSRPKIIEQLQIMLQAQQDTSLDKTTLDQVSVWVEAALPANLDEAQGIHRRPQDPVEAFVFVGTRYPQRTTFEMIDSLRGQGYNDVMILDLAIAIADANQWSRLHRLLGLPAYLLVNDSGANVGGSPTESGHTSVETHDESWLRRDNPAGTQYPPSSASNL